MQSAEFKPGFRLSLIDVAVLIGGMIGAAVLWSITWWWGFVIAFVIMHFFLFCNVVRASRPLELVWAGVFVVLAGATITLEKPGWTATTAISLGATIVVVFLEMRKPSYHGAGWKWINPKLPVWWNSANEPASTNSPEKG